MRLARLLLTGAAALLMSAYVGLAALAIAAESDLSWRLFYTEWALRYWPVRTKLHYALGTELHLDSDREYLGRYGWSEPENWGVWIDGREASLFLRLADAPAQNLRLRARLRREANARDSRVGVDVIVNGTSVARWELEEREPEAERQAEVPASLIPADRLLRLTFHVRDSETLAGPGSPSPRPGVASVTLEPSETAMKP
jgi:hypothetical protein